MSSVEDRLAARLVEEGDCLVFSGAKTGGGYGKLSVGGRLVMTHRLAYELEYGPIPDGMVVRHKCDNPACCNPEHLVLGTQAENLADMRAKGRHSHGAAHAETIKAGWTDDLREMRAEQTRERMAAAHKEATEAAGVPEDWKFCPKCEEWYPRVNFHKNAARHDGLKPHCKECAIIMETQRRRAKRADPT